MHLLLLSMMELEVFCLFQTDRQSGIYLTCLLLPFIEIRLVYQKLRLLFLIRLIDKKKYHFTALPIGPDRNLQTQKYVNTTQASAQAFQSTTDTSYSPTTGSNLVISNNDNLIQGSLFVGSNLRTGVRLSGDNYAMMRSVGYEGFYSASTNGKAGFMIFSGLVLPYSTGDSRRAKYEGAEPSFTRVIIVAHSDTSGFYRLVS